MKVEGWAQVFSSAAGRESFFAVSDPNILPGNYEELSPPVYSQAIQPSLRPYPLHMGFHCPDGNADASLFPSYYFSFAVRALIAPILPFFPRSPGFVPLIFPTLSWGRQNGPGMAHIDPSFRYPLYDDRTLGSNTQQQ